MKLNYFYKINHKTKNTFSDFEKHNKIFLLLHNFLSNLIFYNIHSNNLGKLDSNHNTLYNNSKYNIVKNF